MQGPTNALGWDAPPRSPAVRVRVLGRPGCHLCEDATVVVRQVCADGEWDEVAVTDDPGLLDRYSDEVPVVLVDGAVLTYWRVGADQLRAALDRA